LALDTSPVLLTDCEVVKINSSVWLEILGEGIPLLLLIALGLTVYRGFMKNSALLAEGEDLLKRYLIFRTHKQIRLKVSTDDREAYQELIKTISNSWKNFKKTYDQNLVSISENTARTRLTMQIITLGLLLNTSRLLIGEFFFSSSKLTLLSMSVREFSSYVLVILSFCLLRIQTRRFLHPKGKTAEMDRDILFFPNNLSESETEGLYDQFEPIEVKGEEHGKKDQNHDRGPED
jgi:hypothetical protein